MPAINNLEIATQGVCKSLLNRGTEFNEESPNGVSARPTFWAVLWVVLPSALAVSAEEARIWARRLPHCERRPLREPPPEPEGSQKQELVRTPLGMILDWCFRP
jgi:hypothetical protein